MHQGTDSFAAAWNQFLEGFTPARLIQLLQGAAVVTVVLNLVALWKQEAVDPGRAAAPPVRPSFRETWADFVSGGSAGRLLLAVGLGAASFTMQDILLEPFGGEILHQTVAQTTWLTAILAGGNLAAFVLAGYLLGRGGEPLRLATFGLLVGVAAFAAVIAADALSSAWMFRSGAALIGFGNGLFSVGTLIAAMAQAERGHRGLALGAWGAVHAGAARGRIAAGAAQGPARRDGQAVPAACLSLRAS